MRPALGAKGAGSAGAARSRTCWNVFFLDVVVTSGGERTRGCCWSGWRTGIPLRRSTGSAMPKRRGGFRTEGHPLRRRRLRQGTVAREEFPSCTRRKRTTPRRDLRDQEQNRSHRDPLRGHACEDGRGRDRDQEMAQGAWLEGYRLPLRHQTERRDRERAAPCAGRRACSGLQQHLARDMHGWQGGELQRGAMAVPRLPGSAGDQVLQGHQGCRALRPRSGEEEALPGIRCQGLVGERGRLRSRWAIPGKAA